MRAARSPPPRAPVVLKTDILCGSKPFIIEGRGATLIFDSPLDYTKYLFSTHHAREWRTVCSIFGRRWGSRFLFRRHRRQAARRLHRCRRAFLIFGAKKRSCTYRTALGTHPARLIRHGQALWVWVGLTNLRYVRPRPYCSTTEGGCQHSCIIGLRSLLSYDFTT